MLENYFFVVYITTLIFISGAYLFAYKVLERRVFAFLAGGWLLNAGYLVLEAVMHRQRLLLHPLILVSLGLTSSAVFHLGVLSPSDHTVKRIGRVIGVAGTTFLCAVAVFIVGDSVGIREEIAFFGAAWIPVVYTVFVLFCVALTLADIFPEEDNGFLGRLLFGSWALYANLQLFYPLRMVEHLQSFFTFLFVAAFVLKLLGAAALLRLLQEVFREIHARATHSSVIAELGDLAAGIHHDISTPLGIIDLAIDELESLRGNDKVVQTFLRRIDAPIHTMEGALRMINLARLDPKEASKDIGPVSIRAAINRATTLFKATFSESRIRIVGPSADAPNIYVNGNIDWLGQAFFNILKNSLEAGGERIWISFRKREWVEVTFENDGRSMSEDELQMCRRPGWSSKSAGKDKANVGMGLYMTSKIVQMHRGSITIENRATREGVRSVVRLPASRRR